MSDRSSPRWLCSLGKTLTAWLMTAMTRGDLGESRGNGCLIDTNWAAVSPRPRGLTEGVTERRRRKRERGNQRDRQGSSRRLFFPGGEKEVEGGGEKRKKEWRGGRCVNFKKPLTAAAAAAAASSDHSTDAFVPRSISLSFTPSSP